MKFFVTDLSNCSWSAKAQLSLKRRETSELEILRARTESVKCVAPKSPVQLRFSQAMSWSGEERI